jgi:hypothetical protein
MSQILDAMSAMEEFDGLLDRFGGTLTPRRPDWAAVVRAKFELTSFVSRWVAEAIERRKDDDSDSSTRTE